MSIILLRYSYIVFCLWSTVSILSCVIYLKSVGLLIYFPMKRFSQEHSHETSSYKWFVKKIIATPRFVGNKYKSKYENPWNKNSTLIILSILVWNDMPKNKWLKPRKEHTTIHYAHHTYTKLVLIGGLHKLQKVSQIKLKPKTNKMFELAEHT